MFKLEVQWTHFPLHPSTPDEGLTLEQLFAGRGVDVATAKARMERLMAEEGLDYGDRTMTFNSRQAQELSKWAETQMGASKIHNALFRAYFVEGQNLADSTVLASVVEGVGLDPDLWNQARQGGKWKAAVDEDWRRSYRLGVTGVPTFRYSGAVLVGAQPLENLVAWVTRVDNQGNRD